MSERQETMKFPDRRHKAKMQRLPSAVSYDEKAKKWVSFPIRVYVSSDR